MSGTAALKVCVVCGQDVSQRARVKDPGGNYYCEPCYSLRTQAPPPVAMAAEEIALKDESSSPLPAVIAVVAARQDSPPSPGSDELLLKDEPVAKPKRAAVAPAKPAADAPAPAPVKLPDRCPACGTPVLTKSKYCVGCLRDLTKMDKLKAIMADGEREVASQKSAKIVAKLIGVGVGVVIVVILGLIFYGQILGMIGPGDAYAQYATQREPMLRSFLAHIAGGTDKDYQDAYKLMSQRETGITVAGSSAIIGNMHGMHAELEKLNGADWPGKMSIAIPAFDPIVGDEVKVAITIGKNTYHIGLQVQMSDVVAMGERRIRPKARRPHREDGKVHWGIGEVVEFPLTEGRKEFRPGCDVFDDEAPGVVPGL